MKKRMNFARFYALCRTKGVDIESSKEDLVLQFTDGRTSSLREMREDEYREMCDSLQGVETVGDGELRKRRSAVLSRLQRLGVDTSDWAAVNAFCSSPRIAGKPFGRLTAAELREMLPKLESMLRKKAEEKEKAEAAARAAKATVWMPVRRNAVVS